MSQTPEQPSSRYVVGLDLGTTNSALAYVDTAAARRCIETLPIPQVIAPGLQEARETLPSFHYQPAPHEFSSGDLKLPWKADHEPSIIGHFARDLGTVTPARLINSAKSWLCHGGVDRTADLLPWHGAADVTRLSPVTVSARYLAHFRSAWDHQFPQSPLAEQDFILTLPASFDEVARELTVRAAQQAGLKRVVLIEEPQAAFYAWIDKHADRWDELVSAGQKILVCDIGGGTTDFTLIRVRKGPDGLVQFHRVAVGDHLILGGDNLDLALAHFLERKLKGDGKLDPRAWSVLVRSCRQLKEILLGPNPPEQYTLSLPATGSKLIGGAIQVPITRDEVLQTVLEGFFPLVPLDVQPVAAQSGFQEFGLPYAPDPAITKYLAAFLSAHRHAGDDGSETTTHDPARPDLLLFNGGVFESTAIRQRIIDQLQSWFRHEDPQWSITVLDNERLDLAVARGAAYYGMVRRGEGVRIAAGLARTYYIGVESADAAPLALCLCPAGLEAGQEIDLTQRVFELRLSEPVEFPLYVSSTRLTDQAGDLIPVEREQLTALPPIRTVIKPSKSAATGSVRVILKARLTEIGTLDLWCSDLENKQSWKLLFDVRSTTQTDREATEATATQQGVLDDSQRDLAVDVIKSTFQRGGADPATLMKRLGDVLVLPRDEWPPTLLRQLWEVLLEVESARQIGPVYEARWLNLLGFCLRPGYGLAVDDWRVSETWKRLNGKLTHSAVSCRVEWWILWRRIAGGLTAGQQQALAGPLTTGLKTWSRTASKPRSVTLSPHEVAEQCRMLGALEWLSATTKETCGQILLEMVENPRLEAVRSAALWSLARLGSRQPMYGPLNTVLNPEIIAHWLERLLNMQGSDPLEAFTLMQLSRKTGDRYRDIQEGLRAQVIQRLAQMQAPAHFSDLVRDVGALDAEEQNAVFGEALPRGLRIL